VAGHVEGVVGTKRTRVDDDAPSHAASEDVVTDAEASSVGRLKRARAGAGEEAEEDDEEAVEVVAAQPLETTIPSKEDVLARVLQGQLGPQWQQVLAWSPEGQVDDSCKLAVARLQSAVTSLAMRLHSIRAGLPICPLCIGDIQYPVELSDCGHLFCTAW
jgi:hypothetical protein